jgi:hypothetical protein
MSSLSSPSPLGSMSAEDFANFMDSNEPINKFLDGNEVSRHSDDDHQFSIDRDPTPGPADNPKDELHSTIENSDTQALSSPSIAPKSQQPSDSGPSAFHAELSVKGENSDDLYAPASPSCKRPSANDKGENTPTPVLIQSKATSSIFPKVPVGSPLLRTGASAVGSNEDLSVQQSSVAIALDVNDNEEVVVIKKQNASPEAKRRWEKLFVIDEDDEVFFVKEPKATPAPAPDHPPQQENRLDKMMAAQHAMMLGGPAKGVGVGSSSIFDSQKPAEEDDNLRGKNRRRDPKPVFPVEDRSQIDAGMQDCEADHLWMEAEVEVDEEYNQIQRRKLELETKAKNGKITDRETAEYDKLLNRLKLKERLRAAAVMDDESEDEGLFVKESREETLRRHRLDAERRGMRNNDSPVGDDLSEGSQPALGDDDEDAALVRMLQDELDGNGLEGVSTENVLSKTKKPRKKPVKTAREWNARRNEELREKERKKEVRKKSRPAANFKIKDTGKAGGIVKKGEGKGKEKGKTACGKTSGPLPRSGEADNIGQMILEDLMNNDPIADRLQDPVFATSSAPDILGKQVKDTQLRRLFANIPEESNARTARDDKIKLRLASQSFGYAKVKAVDGKWLIKGMTSTLYHHQLLGAQWMVSRELSAEPPHGGLLADSMGLGKTVQMLACMVGNLPTAADRQRGVKSTLIVVPGAVIDQWLEEIRFHAEKKTFPKVMRYKASTRMPLEVLQDLDIVVTSYTEVMKQFPFPDEKARQDIAQIGYKKWWKRAVSQMGELHSVNWYRVVLDEAHAIKNNSARTSLACQNLKSVYRWCLTGTPLLNRLEE